MAAIPEEVGRTGNMGYVNPASMDFAACAAASDTLVMLQTGEMPFWLH